MTAGVGSAPAPAEAEASGAEVGMAAGGGEKRPFGDGGAMEDGQGDAGAKRPRLDPSSSSSQGLAAPSPDGERGAGASGLNCAALLALVSASALVAGPRGAPARAVLSVVGAVLETAETALPGWEALEGGAMDLPEVADAVLALRRGGGGGGGDGDGGI